MADEFRLSLTQPQAEFVQAEDTFPAIVAGFGSGKTEALVSRCLVRKLSFPAGWVGYYAPTFDLVNLIAIPRFEDMLERHGWPYKVHKTEMVLRIRGLGAIVFRTMDRPERIIGYEHADAAVDELDTLKEDHAARAWNRIIARNRQKKPFGEANTVAVGTTPEGFRFTYRKWVKEKRKGYRVIRASTHSNAHNLPDGYIDSLRATYPPQLLDAYLDGLFVNLTSGAVYPEFDRAKNHTPEKIGPREPLHIGMDFNILHMAATVAVIRDGLPLVLDEFVELRDTPTMIEAIKRAYPQRSIVVYPDASSANDSTSTSLTDLSLLRAAGFTINTTAANPDVRDRVASVNGMIVNGDGKRRLLVNTDACPTLTEALEQQVYDPKGAPDKTAGLDHVNDALGYFVHRRYPALRMTMQRVGISGV